MLVALPMQLPPSISVDHADEGQREDAGPSSAGTGPPRRVLVWALAAVAAIIVCGAAGTLVWRQVAARRSVVYRRVSSTPSEISLESSKTSAMQCAAEP